MLSKCYYLFLIFIYLIKTILVLLWNLVILLFVFLCQFFIQSLLLTYLIRKLFRTIWFSIHFLADKRLIISDYYMCVCVCVLYEPVWTAAINSVELRLVMGGTVHFSELVHWMLAENQHKWTYWIRWSHRFSWQVCRMWCVKSVDPVNRSVIQVPVGE